MNRPAQLISQQICIFEFSKSGNKIIGRWFEPGINRIAVAEKERLVHGGLEFFTLKSAVLSYKFSEFAAELSKEFNLDEIGSQPWLIGIGGIFERVGRRFF